MGSSERPLFDGESWTGEEIHPAHFYAAYLFDQPEVHDQDIAAIVSKAKEFGYPTRFWWLSDAMDLEESPDRLIVCVHHASFSGDAGMDLYRALKEQQISWAKLESAAAVEYLMVGKPLRGLEDLRTPDGAPLFPHENPAVIEWVQPREGLRMQLEVADPVMDILSPEEREKLRQALGGVALLFSAVLAYKEAGEQAGEDFEETLDFLAGFFTGIAQYYDTALSHVTAAIEREFPLIEPDQEANQPSHLAALVGGTQLDDADAIVEAAFAIWMVKVDEIVQDMADCSVFDLPDIDYRGFFEIGIDPYAAADTALLEAGWFS